MTPRLRDDSGVALVVAVLISLLMLGMGLALLSFADQQVARTGTERVNANALSLAEGALNAQANLLSAAWPETSDLAFAPCTQSSTSVKCPDPASLLRGFSGADFGPNGSAASWSISVRVSLYVDAKWNEAPRETELTSGVFLRNQNGSPTASFNVTAGSPGSKKLTLNAGTSTDPEGLPLVYRWCDTTTNSLCDNTTKVGTGVLYTYTAPAAGSRSIVLQVFDVGGLTATAGPLTVTAP